MKFCLFDDQAFGVIEKDLIYPVGSALYRGNWIHRTYTMRDMIIEYTIRESFRQAISDYMKSVTPIPLSQARLQAPLPWIGSKIMCAGGNGADHSAGARAAACDRSRDNSRKCTRKTRRRPQAENSAAGVADVLAARRVCVSCGLWPACLAV